MKFKAAVLPASGQPLVIEDLEVSALKPADVLIRVAASGLCHTDLEVIEGSWPRPTPIVLGHEGAGVVEAVGEDVTLVRPGDHVVASWNPTCGHCFFCDRNEPILCEPYRDAELDGRLIDGELRLHGAGPVHHFMHVSSHAEYCVVDQTSAVAIPNDIPFDRACLIGCGVMTGVGAAMRIACVSMGSCVVVFGAGAVGLNVVQGAHLLRAGAIVAVDVSEQRLELAGRLGATHLLDPGKDDVLAEVRDLTRGRGADYTFEAAGSTESLRGALEAARPGATVVILGKTNVDAEIALRFGSLLGEKRITRSSYGGARPRDDFPFLARSYLEGDLKLDELVGSRISLAEINEGFEAMRRVEFVRSVIVFD